MSYSAQIKELFRKYGKVAIGVHFTIYAATLSGALVVLTGLASAYDLELLFRTK